MKILFCLLLWGTISSGVYAQRVLPAKSKEQKRTEKQIEKKENSLRQKDTELRWDPRRLPSKSKGFPEISAWQVLSLRMQQKSVFLIPHGSVSQNVRKSFFG